MTTYYTTKYSLSNGGKITTQGSDVAPTEHGYVRCKGSWSSLKVGRDTHTDPLTALEYADVARKKKIARLHAQIVKLEKLKFSIVEEGNG